MGFRPMMCSVYDMVTVILLCADDFNFIN